MCFAVIYRKIKNIISVMILCFIWDITALLDNIVIGYKHYVNGSIVCIYFMRRSIRNNGKLIDKESESFIQLGLEIPRTYIMLREEGE